MPKCRRMKGAEMDVVEITDEWFDDPHPNPLHPKGVVINTTERCVEVNTRHGMKFAKVGWFLVSKTDPDRLVPFSPEEFHSLYAIPVS